MTQQPNSSLTDWTTRAILKTNLEVAFTFVEIAQGATDAEKRERNRTKARATYDAVSRQMPQVQMSAPEASEIRGELVRLKLALQKLGESF